MAAFQPVYPQLGVAPQQPYMMQPAPTNDWLFNTVAMACMAAVTLYILLQIGQSILGLLQRTPKAASAAAAAAQSHQQQLVAPVTEDAAGQSAAVPATDDQDVYAFEGWLKVLWPAGHALWRNHPAGVAARRVLPLLPNVLVVVLAVVLTIWIGGIFASGGRFAEDDADSAIGAGGGGSSTADSLRLEWYAGISYVMVPFATTQGRVQKMPVVECAQFGDAARVQDKIIGPPPPDDQYQHQAHRGADVQYLARLEQERTHLRELRAKSLRRCLLADPHGRHIGASGQGGAGFTEESETTWIARAQQAAHVGPLRQLEGRVTDVLLARNGTRYLRLLVAPSVPPSNKGSSGSASPVIPEPWIVTDTALLAAVEQWHARFLELARRNVLVYPCVCPAHLGIVNSGMHFYYDYEAPDNAGLDKAQRGRWHILLDVQMAPFGSAGAVGLVEVDMTGLYREYMTSFPLAANAAWSAGNGSTLSAPHPEMSTVQYFDLTAPTLAADYERVEPLWVASNAPPSPFGIVMPLKSLTSGAARLNTVRHMTNACFYHCKSLDSARP